MTAAVDVVPAAGGRPGPRPRRDGGRAVFAAGVSEAARLCRNPFNLGGLAVAAFLVWRDSHGTVPQWWVWDVQLCSILLAFAGPVLVTSQLAASRVRRDGMSSLYESFPVPASSRVLAHLLGLAGTLVLACAFLGASVAWLYLLGPVGSPRASVLVQGVLLVALAGAAGVALGVLMPSPAAGMLAVIAAGVVEADLLVPWGAPVALPHGTAWLFPWTQPAVLGFLPGPVSAIPPPAHLPWLAALAVLFAVVAYGRSTPLAQRPGLATGATALVAACSVALAGWSGWAQTRPVPPATVNALSYQATHPAQAEQCVAASRVEYCHYRGLAADVARWRAVVNGVFGLLPRRPAARLVVRQVIDTDVDASWLSIGYQVPAEQNAAQAAIMKFTSAERSDPRLIPGSASPPVYVDVNWASGGAAGPYQLGLAVQVAWWLAGLPTTWRTVWYQVQAPGQRPARPEGAGPFAGPGEAQANLSCLPVGQAREAIALWLAASVSPGARSAFLASLAYGPGTLPVTGTGRGRVALVRAYTGLGAAGYAPAVQFTAQGARLATEMLALPANRVTRTLARQWPWWLSPHATDARLAAALGIPLPAGTGAGHAGRDTGVAAAPVSAGQPAQATCQ